MRKKIFFRFISLFFFIFIMNLYADKVKAGIITNAAIANGTTFLVNINADHNVSDLSLSFQEKNYDIYPYGDAPTKHFYALVSVNYYAKTGVFPLTLSYKHQNQTHTETMHIEVEDGGYNAEKLTVAKNKAKPNPKSRERIQREYQEAMEVYSAKTTISYWKKSFILPMNTKITSPFGTKRVFNQTVKSYHSGIDFKAPVGSKIIAANDGKVVLAKERFYAGNSVIIDHGRGVFTVYYHLSKIHVKPGDLVKRGELLGLSGVTGRVTGPHLHFGARVNGLQVDPVQLIEILNLMPLES